MFSTEIKIGDEIQVGDIIIRTKKTSSTKKTRVYIDAPEDVKIIRNPEKPPKVRVVSEKVLS